VFETAGGGTARHPEVTIEPGQTDNAGTGFTVEGARIAILNHSPQFKLHELTVEQEKVGMLDTAGILVVRTLSWILVPLIASAILGESSAFFPAFPVDGCGGLDFAFTEAVNAVRTLLDRRDRRLKMELRDIMTSPKDKKSLYFSVRLQNAVLLAMQEDLPKLSKSLERWIETRFERERQAVTGGSGGATATPSCPSLSQMPAASGVNTGAQTLAPSAGRGQQGAHGGERTAECSWREVSGRDGAAATAGRARNIDPIHTPVGTGTVAKAAGDEGSGRRLPLPVQQTPAAPSAEDILLLKALADAGVNLRRVQDVRQPDPRCAALSQFQAMGLELAAAGMHRGEYVNPAGHMWVLLAMPGEDLDQQHAAAAEVFRWRGLALQARDVRLASTNYIGVCVLAREGAAASAAAAAAAVAAATWPTFAAERSCSHFAFSDAINVATLILSGLPRGSRLSLALARSS
jgi:hypothetical protein